MAEGWLGKSISIKCIEPVGTVFQGTIKEVSPDVITIVRAFWNGVPVRKAETEVKIASANIASLELITEGTAGNSSNKPTPAKQSQSQDKRQQPKNNTAASSNGFKDPSPPYQQLPRNSTAKSPNNKKFFPSNAAAAATNSTSAGPDFPRQSNVQSSSKPLDMQRGNSNNGGGGGRNFQDNLSSNGNGRNSKNGGGGGGGGRRYQNSKSETFGTPVNDPTMEADFDFEKNLALFDKQAVWEKFNQMNGGKPDLLHHQGSSSRSYPVHQPTPKYRHDENIIQSAPTQYRQIEVDYNSSRDYVSDDGLIVPSIPLIVRNRLQTTAEAMGITWERQIDILSRGTCDTALQLLGGAPRLKPNNKHQWPNIVVICEEPFNER